MKLITKEILKKIPGIGEQDGKGEDARVFVKFFNPVGAATWYATEFDGKDLFFGYVDLGLGPGCSELGYFSLQELKSVRCPFGLSIERDLYWDDTKTLGDVMGV